MPLTTDSIESAIISLEGSEYFIPFVPIEIPSLIPIVLKISGTAFFLSISFFICRDSSFRCILHGFPSYPVLAIPMNGFSKSSFVNPIA